MELTPIPLRLKYRHDKPVKQYGSAGGNSGGKKRSKAGKTQEPQHRTLNIDGRTGRQSWR